MGNICSTSHKRNSSIETEQENEETGMENETEFRKLMIENISESKEQKKNSADIQITVLVESENNVNSSRIEEIEVSSANTTVTQHDEKKCSLQSYQKLRRLSYDPRLLDEPPDLRYCGEDVRSLILGRVNQTEMKCKLQQIYIYICCSLADEEIENTMLQTMLFSSLRYRTAELGYELNIVNFHYGIHCDCIADHSYKDICIETLKELKKTKRLIILVLFNEQMDDPCLPLVIEESDLDCALHKIESAEDKEFINRWYIVDENAMPPSYQLHSISRYIPDILSTNTLKRKLAIDIWRKNLKRILSILSDILPEDRRHHYLTTMFEEEIKRTVLEYDDLAERCILFYRKQKTKANNKIYCSVVSTLDRILPDNRKILLNDNEKEYLLAEEEIMKLIKSIVNEVELEYEKKSYKGMEEPLYKELLLQWSYSHNHSSKFIGRQTILNNIRHYLVDESSCPLIIYGPAGCGKTCLIAKAAVSCSSWMPNSTVILRHVGISSESSTQELLLRSVSEHCCILIGDHPSLAFKSINEHNAAFELLLRKSCQRNHLILLIDGLDQVTHYSSRDLSWFPTKLPHQVKFVISVRDNSSELKQLRDIFPEACFLPLTELTQIESISIVDDILIANKRRITDSQRALVRKCLLECPYPRYARLLGYLAIKWSSTNNSEQIKVYSNIDGIIEGWLLHLEKLIGKSLLHHVIGFLVAAKHGLTDEELLDILSCEENNLSKIFFEECNTAVDRFPRILWQLVKYHLLPFLDTRIICHLYVNTWKNQYYRYRCWEYIREQNCDKFKNALMVYFSGKRSEGNAKIKSIKKFILEHPTMYGNHPNRRKLDELPSYCLDQNCPTARSFYLFNPEWIVAKCRASDPYQFLEDISLYISHNAVDSEVYLLRDVVLLSSYALRYDSSQFYSQFYGRLKNILSEEENIVKYPSLKAIYDLTTKPAIPSLLPLVPCLREPIIASATEIKMGDGHLLNGIFTIKDDQYHVVTLSEEMKEIAVWNIYQHTPVRTLRITLKPRDIKIIDGYKGLVLCDRELILYDLNSGRFIVRLKGIMNQKMPYYGIKDNTYVVALSRNRMYVNFMNLNTGDMETTFKVGEDRFLNSLIVSANGRICVCGDETQKPFPLLVWDLNERKLIYDLRMPQHEFLTNMTAISDDGRYLISVCRELSTDESSTNFIVVYDLESGTLFKKWKPDGDTCGIAISHFGDQLINGLESGLVLVWDLVTGTNKFTLKGHTAPVNQIRIDNQGLVCVTYDSVGRDRSLRMWDLECGVVLSVFTPDQAILCCELSFDGKAVILGLNNQQSIVTLLLCHKNSIEEQTWPSVCFGDKEYANKIFNVHESTGF